MAGSTLLRPEASSPPALRRLPIALRFFGKGELLTVKEIQIKEVISVQRQHETEFSFR